MPFKGLLDNLEYKDRGVMPDLRAVLVQLGNLDQKAQ